jgi:lysophospholipase L1-like esterase
MQTIKLDIAQKNNVPLLYVKQRDVGHKFAIELYENGTPYSVDEENTFAVWYSGASGDGNYTTIGDETAVFADRNVITVQMIMQMLNEPGGHEMCVVMYGQDNEQKGFWNIPYYVEAIPGADSEAATAYYNAFLDAQKKAEEAAERAEEAAERAEAAADRAESAVTYTPQALTEEQKAQARENIGAVSADLFEITEETHDELTSIIDDASIFTAGKMIHIDTGDVVDVASYYCTEEYIPIPASARLFSHYAASSTKYAYPQVAFYDKNKNFICNGDGPAIAEQTEYEGMLGVFYDVPQNTRYIRISVMKKYIEQYFDYLFVYIVIEKAFPTAVEIPGLITPKSKIEGENIVFFGDSIFGMYRDKTSVANRTAEMTGANVYNVGFGGCRMSVHPTTGYSEFSMWALADAIYNENWTAQDAAASSGASYFPEQLNILKSIDFNAVDRVVIHYGTNDFTGDRQIDNSDNPLDYSTLCGALRYSLEKLLTKYPHLRIYVSLPTFRYWKNDAEVYPDTHTNGNGKTLLDFVEAIADTAKEYCVPIIDGYHGIGVNKLNVPTFLEDGTHHNEAGRKRLGYYIASKICAEL